MAHCGALRQFAQNIINACDEYERQVQAADAVDVNIISKTEVITYDGTETN